jgi:hypothetical protein
VVDTVSTTRIPLSAVMHNPPILGDEMTSVVPLFHMLYASLLYTTLLLLQLFLLKYAASQQCACIFVMPSE